MCIIPLGPCLDKDLHGEVIDLVLKEQSEARRLIEADDPEGALQVLNKVIGDLEKEISDLEDRDRAALAPVSMFETAELRSKLSRTKTAAFNIQLRTTNGGHLARD